MGCRSYLLIAIAVGMALADRPGFASDRDACGQAGADQPVAACTRAIASGQFKGAALGDLYFWRGKHKQDQRDYDGAVADFDQMIKLDPTVATGYSHRAEAWRHKGDHDRAIADYGRAIALDPDYDDAYHGRAIAWAAKGDHDRAIADYGEAIRLYPKGAIAYYNRALSWSAKADHDRAIADFSVAISLDRSSAAFLTMRGKAYAAKSDVSRARADFNAALALPADDNQWAQEAARERLGALGSAPAESAKTAAPAAPPASVDGRRVALVVGNSAYRGVAPLPNPVRDAKTMADTLRLAGFQSVILATDLTREKLIDALRSFGREAERADWAVVYFAGHGIEMGGNNYLIPTDARLEADRDIDLETVRLDQVLAAVEGAKALRLVLFDACRDNPFARQMRRTVATRSVGRGLARIEPDAGTLVVYAAKHGETALDGDAGNSPFVTALVKNLRIPNLEIRKLFDLVRDDVMDLTNRKQQPFTYGSVPGRQDFFFVRK